MIKVEWLCNGKPVPQGHRFRTTYDFGFVALDILYTLTGKECIIDARDIEFWTSQAKNYKNIFTFSMHCENNFPLKKMKSDLDIPLAKGMKDNQYLDILQKNIDINDKVDINKAFSTIQNDLKENLEMFEFLLIMMIKTQQARD